MWPKSAFPRTCQSRIRSGYYNAGHKLSRQFQRYFTPQAELEQAFIYIIHKPIDFSIEFSHRLKTYVIWSLA